ncbi:Brp/Blh family beta-carotene 15,15'-dioxygenase [uncultured Sphingomonas sp.]|uniref:Brp/Blh family beta-carotene 15,15'-dioxygenase n=1 Tax=uncultured Sphingomonas sp. TaxID=158754 RepID=UPI0035CA8FF6
MIAGRAPSWRWGALIAAGMVASVLPVPGQLVFAAGAVAVLGLPHGASDLAVVPGPRRVSFLLAYGLVILAVLGLWLMAPPIALVGFLVLSAVHFAIDGRDVDLASDRNAGWGLGALLVAGPALLHRQALSGLFASVVQPEAATMLAGAMQVVAIVALVPVIRALMADRPITGSSRVEVIVGLAATLILPPLVGFACGFVLLHARGQTLERQRDLGCASLRDYGHRIAPVLLGAVMVLAGVVLLFTRIALDGTAMLFACIAALAVPHMLVTPLWRRERYGNAVLAG